VHAVGAGASEAGKCSLKHGAAAGCKGVAPIVSTGRLILSVPAIHLMIEANLELQRHVCVDV